MSKVTMNGLTFDCIEVKCNASNDTMQIESYDDDLIFKFVGCASSSVYVDVKDVEKLISYLQTWVSSR